MQKNFLLPLSVETVIRANRLATGSVASQPPLRTRSLPPLRHHHYRGGARDRLAQGMQVSAEIDSAAAGSWNTCCRQCRKRSTRRAGSVSGQAGCPRSRRAAGATETQWPGACSRAGPTLHDGVHLYRSPLRVLQEHSAHADLALSRSSSADVCGLCLRVLATCLPWHAFAVGWQAYARAAEIHCRSQAVQHTLTLHETCRLHCRKLL